MMRRLRLRRMRRAFRALPDRDRAIFGSVRFDDCDDIETAKRHDCSVADVEQTIARVILALERAERYFFMDVARDGIALYQSDDTELHQPKPKTRKEALAMAQEYFGEWFPTAAGFKRNAGYAERDGDLKLAAFLLHQTAERLYHCVLLVCTFYTPHVHNLGFLRTYAERIDPRLVDAWPRDIRVDRARFEKLKEAYVKARYSKHYPISEEELTWLGERVEALGQAVQVICEERIAALERSAA